jgi:hypothetical protein
MIFKTPEELVEFFNKLDLDKSTLVFKAEEEKVVEEKKKEKECPCGRKKEKDCPCSGKKEKECPCGGKSPCQCEALIKESKEDSLAKIDLTNIDSVLIETFTDSPSVKLRISESDTDTFYVKNYEGVTDTCGTGKVELSDRIVYMNMCDQSGVASVDLDLVIEGQQLIGVKVTLAKTEDEPYLVLNKAHFNP